MALDSVPVERRLQILPITFEGDDIVSAANDRVCPPSGLFHRRANEPGGASSDYRFKIVTVRLSGVCVGLPVKTGALPATNTPQTAIE